MMNIWVHDGSKDMTVRRKYYRELLAQSLDEIMKEELPDVKTCFEAKLFGIGLDCFDASINRIGAYLLHIPSPASCIMIWMS